MRPSAQSRDNKQKNALKLFNNGRGSQIGARELSQIWGEISQMRPARERRVQPSIGEKNDFTPYRAQSANPDDSWAIGTRE